MSRLHQVFQRMRADPKEFVGAMKGNEFEDRIMNALGRGAYTRILKADIPAARFKALKAAVQETSAAIEPENPSPDFRQHFLHQPFGSQAYPDLLILDGARVISIETKFSQQPHQGHPVWNGGLPRTTGIYVFGNYGRGDLTFFRGCDVVSPEDIRRLRGFFEAQKAEEMAFNAKEMAEQPYGFTSYVRRTFNQQKKPNREAIVDLFKNPDRQTLEDAVISHLQIS